MANLTYKKLDQNQRLITGNLFLQSTKACESDSIMQHTVLFESFDSNVFVQTEKKWWLCNGIA